MLFLIFFCQDFFSIWFSASPVVPVISDTDKNERTEVVQENGYLNRFQNILIVGWNNSCCWTSSRCKQSRQLLRARLLLRVNTGLEWTRRAEMARLRVEQWWPLWRMNRQEVTHCPVGLPLVTCVGAFAMWLVQGETGFNCKLYPGFSISEKRMQVPTNKFILIILHV